MSAATPLASLWLKRRLRRGKEIAERIGERHGYAKLPRPDGPLVWVHGASVGELNAVFPLIEALRRQHVSVLVTSGTVTSADVARKRLPPDVLHQFIPLDAPRFVYRFLSHWKPDLGIFVESDLWPNLILASAKARIPLVLVNGRMSEDSFKAWKSLKRTAAAILGKFDVCLAQSALDAERYSELGMPVVRVTGNLKLDVPAPHADPANLAAMQQAIGERQVFVAASTHPGEEAAIIEAHRRIRKARPRLLTIIVPRHPERGMEVLQLAVAAGKHRNRPVEIGQRRIGHERLARHRVHGGGDARIGDVIGAQLAVDHHAALLGEIGHGVAPAQDRLRCPGAPRGAFRGFSTSIGQNASTTVVEDARSCASVVNPPSTRRPRAAPCR